MFVIYYKNRDKAVFVAKQMDNLTQENRPLVCGFGFAIFVEKCRKKIEIVGKYA